MTNTGEQAIAQAAQQSISGARFGTGLCLQKVRGCYLVAAKYPDAASAWENAGIRHKDRNPLDIPRGVPVFWTGGSAGHGHIAISTGDGYCWSTDIERPGFFDHVRIADIERRWGLPLVGWTEDLNGVRVWTAPPAPTKEDLMLADLRALCKKYGVSLVYLARICLRAAAKANSGGRLRRINAARVALKGMI